MWISDLNDAIEALKKVVDVTSLTYDKITPCGAAIIFYGSNFKAYIYDTHTKQITIKEVN